MFSGYKFLIGTGKDKIFFEIWVKLNFLFVVLFGIDIALTTECFTLVRLLPLSDGYRLFSFSAIRFWKFDWCRELIDIDSFKQELGAYKSSHFKDTMLLLQILGLGVNLFISNLYHACFNDYVHQITDNWQR